MSLRLDNVKVVDPWRRAATEVPIDVEVEAGEIGVHECPPELAAVLLRVVIGLDVPSGGRVLVGDRDVTHWDVHRRVVGYVDDGSAVSRTTGPMLGFVTADRGLLPHLTIGENIRYWCSDDAPGAEKEAWTERLGELERCLRLGLARDRLPRRFSTSEQLLKVAVARATFNRPRALVVHLPGPAGRDRQSPDRLRTIFADAVRAVFPDVADLAALADVAAPAQGGPSDEAGHGRAGRWPSVLVLSDDPELVNALPGRYMGGR